MMTDSETEDEVEIGVNTDLKGKVIQAFNDIMWTLLKIEIIIFIKSYSFYQKSGG